IRPSISGTSTMPIKWLSMSVIYENNLLRSILNLHFHPKTLPSSSTKPFAVICEGRCWPSIKSSASRQSYAPKTLSISYSKNKHYRPGRRLFSVQGCIRSMTIFGEEGQEVTSLVGGAARHGISKYRNN